MEKLPQPYGTFESAFRMHARLGENADACNRRALAIDRHVDRPFRKRSTSPCDPKLDDPPGRKAADTICSRAMRMTCQEASTAMLTRHLRIAVFTLTENDRHLDDMARRASRPRKASRFGRSILARRCSARPPACSRSGVVTLEAGGWIHERHARHHPNIKGSAMRLSSKPTDLPVEHAHALIIAAGQNVSLRSPDRRWLQQLWQIERIVREVGVHLQDVKS